jgi:CRISPR-associated protein Cst2
MEKINCINISFIFKSSIGAINGSWTEGNVSTVKKITLPNGKRIPYVSGQSLKYQIRRYWEEQGLELSEVGKSSKSKGVNTTLGDPKSYIDDDVMGYMITDGDTRRRTATLRISPAVGLFEYQGDTDLGTKSKEDSDGGMDAGGNLFEAEIYYNFFKVNAMLETDRLGKFKKVELGKNADGPDSISDVERTKRIIATIKAIQHLWGGGKQSRFLTDLSPKMVAITCQTIKKPIFLEGVYVDREENLNYQAIDEILEESTEVVKKSFLGITPGIFNNEEEIKNSSKGDWRSVNTAFSDAITFIEKEIQF